MDIYLGIDVGSVTTKLAAINEENELVCSRYLPTGGKPAAMVQECIRSAGRELPAKAKIGGVATTGSARYLAGAIVGADLVKNEITCQAVGAVNYLPEVRTVIEIGGQDSKIIIIRDGMVNDFGMNTVCAAGTGSFLDHQAGRLGISIEELSRQALTSKRPVNITGRCTVFAESDMVHKQQTGHGTADIIYGLCRALVRNYLSDVASGKDIQSPIVFQGGVAFNQGIIKALREELTTDIIVPPHHEVMGAMGAACLVKERRETGQDASRFRGFEVSDIDYRTSSFECKACPTACEINQITADDRVIAYWGGQCEKWEEKLADKGVKQDR
jgi:predicted CoA-substrate-specific enzyme activase